MKKIAIFASGSGTNAENIANFFQDNKDIEIKLILTNNKHAKVIDRAKKLNIKTEIFTKEEFYKSTKVQDILATNEIDFVVLAGFLWLVPHSLIKVFNKKIINIHPALLPKYGGKGMYGDNVHKAVVANSETESGITIHYVNEKYDDGAIIFQAKCKITKNDTPQDLAQKIHKLEYKHFPTVIEQVVSEK